MKRGDLHRRGAVRRARRFGVPFVVLIVLLLAFSGMLSSSADAQKGQLSAASLQETPEGEGTDQDQNGDQTLTDQSTPSNIGINKYTCPADYGQDYNQFINNCTLGATGVTFTLGPGGQDIPGGGGAYYQINDVAPGDISITENAQTPPTGIAVFCNEGPLNQGQGPTSYVPASNGTIGWSLQGGYFLYCDTESLAIWRDEIGMPVERIQISGKNNRWLEPIDNWWGPVGATGPCGPDSEIYYDWGAQDDTPEEDGPGSDSYRYLEVWNNVFMQYFKGSDGNLKPLPRQNVDTGMGLERLAMVVQQKKSMYDTDLYQPIIQRAATLAGTTYGQNPEHDRALRVIADHSRGSTFLISDGVLPGNEGRSYILRRILRRAIRHGRQLGLDKPFLAQMAEIVIDEFGEEHPALRERRNSIARTITHEEETFSRTLNAGMGRFQTLAAGLSSGGNKTLPGEEVFRLYDTFGFPVDLTAELAKEQGLSVDQEGFDRAMAAQRAASRSGAAFRDESRSRAELYVSLAQGRTEFLGYETTVANSTVSALVGPDGAVDEASAGDPIEVLLDRTPFYGESGGQIGDTGIIRTETGVIRIEDTVRPLPDLFLHRGVVEEGFVRAGEPASAEVDGERRQAIRRNHTATHLLHRALRIVLGSETHQAGSLVAPDRLRFDFTALDAVRSEQLNRIAEIVNDEIMANSPVQTEIKPYQEAVGEGAMALFGEKYGDTVRVVSVPGFSVELCGGTHVRATGEIGPFLIMTEGSVAAGVRRIEAVTGTAAVQLLLQQQRALTDLGRELRIPWTEVPAQVNVLQDRLRVQDREIDRLRGQLAGARVGELLDHSIAVDGTQVLAVRVEADSKDALRQLGDRLRDRVDSGVIVLGSVIDGRPSLLSMVTPDLVNRGVRAGDIVREAATILDGRGGGRPDIAEAGGKDPAKLDDALGAVAEIVKRGMAG